MEKYRPKDEILKGKEEGIRFMCTRHWWMSVRYPCAKCVEELGMQMPSPAPMPIRDVKVTGGKGAVPDLDNPGGIFGLLEDTNIEN